MIKGMEISSNKTFELLIVLDRSCAEWLLSYMQHPKEENESIVDKDLREKMFQMINRNLD